MHSFGYYPLAVRSSSPFRRHYPPFFTHTGSCVRPNPSHRLRLSPYTAGLCRLSSVPAGRWPFPTLGPASLSLDAWTCAPAAPKVHVPVASFGTSAFPTCSPWVGYRKIPRQAASQRDGFSGPSSFLTFRPPVLLATLTAPTVMVTPVSSFAPADGQPVPSFGPGLFFRVALHVIRPSGVGGFSIRAERMSLHSHASDMLTVRTGQLTVSGLSPN